MQVIEKLAESFAIACEMLREENERVFNQKIESKDIL